MSLATCPSPADLERLFLGGLPEQEVEALEQHVLECDSCLKKLIKAFATMETLSGVLRENTCSDAMASSLVVTDLMRKLASLGPTSANPPSQGTSPISVPCSACSKKLSVKESLAGKKVKCPVCGQVTTVPALVAIARQVNPSERTVPPTPFTESSDQVQRDPLPSQVDAATSPTLPPLNKPDEPRESVRGTRTFWTA